MAIEDAWIGRQGLCGEVQWTPQDLGMVVCAHGSRNSPRNRSVATVMHEYRLATLLFDLLTASEAADGGKVFDIGLFGASTGAAAAALCAAAEHPGRVGAVVSRGGRPDLAGPSHLFEEPGTLDAVARLAGAWFAGHLGWMGRSP